MQVFLGADHRGFHLKNAIKSYLTSQNMQVTDLGAHTFVPDDNYPDYAFFVAQKVQENESALGIVLCGSGDGVCIVANKVAGIRCGMALSYEQVKAGRGDDDINVLAIAAEFTPQENAVHMVDAFLQTAAKNEERYRKRREQINKIEKGEYVRD